MYKDNLILLEDIIESCRKITKYTTGYDEQNFMNDDKTVDACVRNLEIIGEASIKLDSEFKNRYAHLEWKKNKGTEK